MKSTFLALTTLLFAASAQAQTLLDCQTTFGPDQRVTVTQEGQVLKLNELTDGGRQVSRILSQEEWDSRLLNLREDEGFTTTLKIYAPDDVVIHVTNGSTWNESGPAICSVVR